MTLKNLVKYSGLWVGFTLNPHHWQLKFKTGAEGLLDDEPSIFGLHVYFGPLWMRIILDDGQF